MASNETLFLIVTVSVVDESCPDTPASVVKFDYHRSISNQSEESSLDKPPTKKAALVSTKASKKKTDQPVLR